MIQSRARPNRLSLFSIFLGCTSNCLCCIYIWLVFSRIMMKCLFFISHGAYKRRRPGDQGVDQPDGERKNAPGVWVLQRSRRVRQTGGNPAPCPVSHRPIAYILCILICIFTCAEFTFFFITWGVRFFLQLCRVALLFCFFLECSSTPEFLESGVLYIFRRIGRPLFCLEIFGACPVTTDSISEMS